MHEAGIAERVLEVVLARAAEAGAARVVVVEVEAGERSGVSEEALRFHWAEAARGTAAEGAEVRIVAVDEPVALRVVAIEVAEDQPSRRRSTTSSARSS